MKNNILKYALALIIIGLAVWFFMPEPEVYGCMDPKSNNFNPGATIDDGSCDNIDHSFTFDSLKQIDSMYNKAQFVNPDLSYINQKEYVLHKMENILLNSNYSNIDLQNYTLGNLYFHRYKEIMAMNELQSEIMMTLFSETSHKSFNNILPILNDDSLNPEIIEAKNSYDNYSKNNKVFLGGYIHNQQLDKLENNDFIYIKNLYYSDLQATVPDTAKYKYYNPKYFGSIAEDYKSKSIQAFGKLLFSNLIKESSYNEFITVLKLSLLYAYENNEIKVNSLYNTYSQLNSELVNYINDENDCFDFDEGACKYYIHVVDMIEYLAHLERLNIISVDEVQSIYNRINDKDAKNFYLLKRELLIENAPSISNTNLLEISTNCLDNEEGYYHYLLYPEILMSIAEISYKNDDVDKSIRLMDDFWFTSTCFFGFDPKESGWEYNNFPSFMLRSIRYGFLNGSLLPLWNSKLQKHYSEASNLGEHNNTGEKRIIESINNLQDILLMGSN